MTLPLVNEPVVLPKNVFPKEGTDSPSDNNPNPYQTIQELKLENGRLGNEIEDLQNALENVKKTAPRHSNPINRTSDVRPPFKQPPNKILYMIFLRALSPSFLVDSSLHAGSDSPWCEALRMKKSIVGVCKAWWQVCLELLYEEISIRHVVQIPALLRTLHANKSMGDMIKNFEISCFIPAGYFSLFQADLARIFALCPRITRLNFTAHTSESAVDILLPCIGLPSSLYEACAKLTYLECNRSMDSVCLMSALKVCANLRSLWICLPHNGGPDGFGGTGRHALCLEHLQTLHLTHFTSGRHLSMMARHWLMPTLRNVIINELNRCTNKCREDFFAAFGARLKYVHIRSYSFYEDINMQNCIKHCPVLEHLAIWPTLKLSPMSLSHQTVKWIDLWTSHDDEDQTYRTLRESLSQKAFPSFIGLRELDYGLPAMVDWPSTLPPDSAVDADGVVYRFPGVHVQHTARSIFKMDMSYCGEHEKDNEISDRGSFGGECSESGASDSDSSYILEEDACFSSGGSDMDESGQEDLDKTVDDVDHDMALTIFAQTLD